MTDEDLKFDTRLINRNIRRGIIDQVEYEAHLAELPDVTDMGTGVNADMNSLGIGTRSAEDTGESE